MGGARSKERMLGDLMSEWNELLLTMLTNV
uniref:Uncharacterized protein n=1 Tax=Anguilla anguilla TaxID=7936 RepID=A0A0E9V0X1_ANGAN